MQEPRELEAMNVFQAELEDLRDGGERKRLYVRLGPLETEYWEALRAWINMRLPGRPPLTGPHLVKYLVHEACRAAMISRDLPDGIQTSSVSMVIGRPER